MPEQAQNEKAVMDNRSRLKEMRDILLKYKVVTRGITPEKNWAPLILNWGRSCPCIRIFCRRLTVMS